ncbi:MAG: hypothetical protein GOVbin1573_47 [Prokaryotic dsDNA virus sp.]|nr:MAG: hypothetical protein GOVbin1573_47 [Prokaryotic dsDNA virus sp.]|tara:strand:+ start:4248 stop:4943 length:696 start_codon:yes stop_codon:yes gene_type:complete
MAAPTRFGGGVTNQPVEDFGGSMIGMDPTKWHVFFDDFDTFTAGQWTITTTEAGGGSASEALTDGDGGLLLITNDSADDDADFFQKVGESFLFETGKRLWFKARFKVNDATQSDVVMGLQITDTTPLDVTDGVFFIKADGAATVDFRVEKNNTATTESAVATMANDTFIVLAFYYDGKSKVEAWVDGVKKATLATTNLPDDEALTVSFGIQNGAAAAKTMTLDYVLAAKER